MIILTKSFKKQLKSSKIKIDDVIKGINRVINQKIFRTGDVLLSNSFINLKNCLVVKIRVGEKQRARMLVLFISVNNIKIPFLIALKNDKKFGSNMSLKSSIKNMIIQKADNALSDFNNGNYNEIDEKLISENV
ncbi:MAG: hypothetical protein V1768_01195 [Patescibacteria group bacterium]|nr:hypothetical protein [Patescibacteria group bacterium]